MLIKHKTDISKGILLTGMKEILAKQDIYLKEYY
jgi:hypothetical protein